MKKRILGLLLAFAMLLNIAPVVAADNQLQIERIAGKTRYETSAMVSEKSMTNSDNAIIASGESFPDALAGSQLAAGLNAPILLTGKASLDSHTNNELIRLGVKKIYLLGGEGTISEAVENELKSIATVERVGGLNRYETSTMIAEKARQLGMSNDLVVVSGLNYADALSSGGFIAASKSSMALSDGKDLPKIEYDDIVVFGGRNSLPLPEYNGRRVWGNDRYETSLAIAKLSHSDADTVILTSGENYPDALTAISLAIKENAPIVLVRKSGMDERAKDFIDQNIEKVIIVGGTGSISAEIEKQLKGETPALPVKPPSDNQTPGGSDKPGGDQESDTIKITLNFGYQGSSDVVKTIKKGSTLAEPEKPKRKGYIFIGWYNTKESGYSVDFKTHKFNNDTTIYARWMEDGDHSDRIKVTIDFGYNDYTDVIYVNDEGKIDGIFNPYRENYIFLGLYDNAVNGKKIDLKTMVFTEDTTLYAYWDDVELKEEHFTFDKSTGTITGYSHEGPKNVVIPTKIEGIDVIRIGDNAFAHHRLDSVDIPDQIEEIGNYAFEWNQLTQLKLPDNLQVINYGVFSKNKISSTTIPRSVTTIKESAFEFNQLKQIELHDNITEIGRDAFANNLIEEVSFPESMTEISYGIFNNNKLTKVNIPSSITSIGSNAFSNNQLIEIKLPASLNSIDYGAFENNKLKNIKLPENITVISSHVFKDNDLESISIPNKVEMIGWNAFENNNLVSVDLPSSLTYIHDRAFASNQIESISIPNNVHSMGEYVFYNNAIKEATLSESMSIVPAWAFANNQLESITIPSNVETIKERAFLNNNLATVSLNEGLNTIEKRAFENNKITELNLPSTLTSIETYGFWNNLLTEVNIPTGCNLGYKVFDDSVNVNQ